MYASFHSTCRYLCVSLSKNGVSHVPVVFERSLSIFLVLLSKFKKHLKMQIEVFFKEILFSMLELSTSSFQHKHLVMVCLTKICSDKQTIFDLYLNYDCDEFLNNLFERLVNDVSRASQGRQSSDLGGTPQQEIEMKVKGLECLVLILRCLREWCSDMDDSVPDDGRATPDPEEEGAEPSALHDRFGSEPSGLDDDRSNAGAGDFEARKNQKDMREKGILLFNKKPKKGIKFLQDNKLLGTEEKDIAAFLLAESRLDRTQIGEYLGEPGDYNIKVLSPPDLESSPALCVLSVWCPC
jgi:brefeldin A-inhibited guanine nucleotide-exchange protein